METGVDEMDNGMGAESALAEGLRLIGESSLAISKKDMCCSGWKHWVQWCSDAGVDSLDATWEQVLECLRSVERVAWVKSALRCVYRARGVASPSDDRRLVAGLEMLRMPFAESFVSSTRHKLSLYRSDYLAWCHLQHKKPAPASVEQVVEFLSSIAGYLKYQQVRLANTSVSLYLMEQGYPPTEAHPLVVAALKELEAREAGTGGDGKQRGNHNVKLKRQWGKWLDAQGIVAGSATVADVLQYLKGYEDQRTAGGRVNSLRDSFGNLEPAFWSEEVQDWLRRFKARLSCGDVPGYFAGHVGKVQPVLNEWTAARAARAGAGRRIPVGLTREEVERVRVGQGRQLDPNTVVRRAYIWAYFSEWREARRISLEAVEPVHIRVYLEESAETMAVATLWDYAQAIAFGFEEHGYLNNPALGDEVLDFLSDLAVERKEASAQVDPIRFADLKAILGCSFEPHHRERLARAEIRGALTVSLLRLTFDGLLRGSEVCRARWGDLSRSATGSGTGSLLLPRSKVDKFGRGECTYVSAFALQHLDLLRDLRRFYGKAVGENDLIFGVGVDWMRTLIQQRCAAVGLEGRFGAHSLRVGAAQDLALEGFSLPMIMLAGRWKSPDMPALYIRNIKVLDSAMAQMQRMVASGKYRLGPDARGIDVMSNYDIVNLVR